MGVYIPNLELPNKDYGKMVITIYPDGSVVEYLGDIGRDFGTAISVLPHGRLGDFDEFLNRAFGTGLFNEDDMRLLEELVGDSSIIIPASKEVK